MKFNVLCLYCGHNWIHESWSVSSLSMLRCSKEGCGDKNLKIKELSFQSDETDPFGYRFSPAFPEKIEPIKDDVKDDPEAKTFYYA